MHNEPGYITFYNDNNNLKVFVSITKKGDRTEEVYVKIESIAYQKDYFVEC
jgi:hypothetical protein